MTVQKPTSLNLTLDVDIGELEAICLAQEIKAAAVLMDDRAGRAVVGTIGLLEQAVVRGLLDLPHMLARLQQTNARLDPKFIATALERDKSRKKSKE